MIQNDKIVKLDCIEIKSFCSAKQSIERIRTPIIDQVKIFPKDTSDKGLLCKISKGLLKLNSGKTNTQLKNESKTLTDISSKKICR